jgi:hypothetical protein
VNPDAQGLHLRDEGRGVQRMELVDMDARGDLDSRLRGSGLR